MALRQRILLLGTFAIACMAVALWLQYRSHSMQTRAIEVIKRNVGAASALSAAVHELQKERGLTAIAGPANGAEPLLVQTRDTDAALARLAAAGVEIPEGQTSLQRLRAAGATRTMTAMSIADGYTVLLRMLIDEMDRLSREPEAAVAKADIAAHAHLVAAKEYLGQIRATLGHRLEHGGDPRLALESLIRLKVVHDEELRKFGLQASPELRDLLAARFAGEGVRNMRNTLSGLISGNPRQGMRPGEWFAFATAGVDGLKAVEDESLRLIESKAEQSLAELRRAMRLGILITACSGIAVFLLTVSTTVSLLRQIRRALSSIERISSSKDFSNRIPADGPDEIGRISLGFNKLLDVVEQLLREKEYLANTDMLTGIHNRLRFAQVLHEEAERKRRNKTPMALAMFDIDHFKRINDTHGHNAGDEVLKHLVEVVKGNVRATDIFARWGGEEFVLLLRDDDCRAAMALAEKIRNAVAAADFPVAGSISCSFGVTGWRSGDTESEFIARADQGLYDAKRRGRNRVCCALFGSAQCEAPTACAR